MKIVIQRVLEASVTINNIVVASINQGLLVLLGIENDDTTCSGPSFSQDG